MDKLEPIFSRFLDVGKLFLHQRYACHNIKLIVKEALHAIKLLSETFSTIVSFLNSSNQRIVAYKSYYITTGVRPIKFGLDMDARWNSTYLMLKHLFPRKATLSTFIQDQYHRIEDVPFLLTNDHQAMSKKVLDFLKCFMIQRVALFGIQYPTPRLMIHHLIKIAIHLRSTSDL